jgi:hypothetical protein
LRVSRTLERGEGRVRPRRTEDEDDASRLSTLMLNEGQSAPLVRLCELSEHDPAPVEARWRLFGPYASARNRNRYLLGQHEVNSLGLACLVESEYPRPQIRLPKALVAGSLPRWSHCTRRRVRGRSAPGRDRGSAPVETQSSLRGENAPL